MQRYFQTKYIQYAVIIITAGYLLVSGVSKPRYDWDMIPYVAAAYHEDGLRGKALSSATYKDVEQEVSAKKFASLIEGNYRATVFKDPNSLAQQLPFYQIRVVYIGLMRLLKNFGITYPQATYIISAFFASSSIIILASFCVHFHVSVLFVPFVAAFSGITLLARTSSPDAIACFFALFTVWLFIKRSRVVYLLTVIMPLIRTDLVIMSNLVMSSTFIQKRSFYPIFGAIAATISYFAINRITGNYGYLTLFNFTFLELDPYPRNMNVSTEVGSYLKPYLDLVLRLPSKWHAAIYLLVFYFFVVRKMYKTLNFEINAIILISSLYAALHLTLFPVYDNRFFAFSVSLLLIALLAAISQYDQAKPYVGY